MADIEFSCKGCGQHLEAPPEMAGETVECPQCGTRLEIPSLTKTTLIAPPPSPAAGQKCPECGADMAADAVLCIHCGFHQKLGKKIDTQLS